MGEKPKKPSTPPAPGQGQSVRVIRGRESGKFGTKQPKPNPEPGKPRDGGSGSGR